MKTNGNGIVVSKTTSNFAGGISNTGTISGGQAGILLSAATFAGGIDNRGAIFAGFQGLAVGGLGFAGGISNGGTIVSTNTGILVALPVFSGGINNTGTISGGGPRVFFSAARPSRVGSPTRAISWQPVHLVSPLI